MPNITTQAVICQLLMYVHANPIASDSAEGIAQWWLDPKEGVNVQLVGDVLDFLVDRGMFAKRVAADGRHSYRRSCTDAQIQQVITELLPLLGGCDDTSGKSKP
jgi:hypothetical protein